MVRVVSDFKAETIVQVDLDFEVDIDQRWFLDWDFQVRLL